MVFEPHVHFLYDRSSARKWSALTSTGHCCRALASEITGQSPQTLTSARGWSLYAPTKLLIGQIVVVLAIITLMT
jgi:hypothetical protein